MEGYIVPNYVKRRRKNRPDTKIMSFAEKLERERSSLLDDEGWLSKIRGMLRHVLDQMRWTTKPSVCCLGLGSPSSSRSARLQLALILEILSYLELPPGNASLYDPVFTDEDMDGFQSLGLNAVTKEEAMTAQHIFTEPTLVIMPHCDIELYRHLLECNWSRDSLSMVVVLGNPLDQYPLTIQKERLSAEFLSVQLIAHHPDWCTIPIPEATCDDKAFVALAFQYLAVREDQPNDERAFWAEKQAIS